MNDVHTSVGAYVSDALDGAERDDFEAHLVDCELCRQEVAEFDETLAEFARLAASAPPRGLRDQVLAEIHELRPLPPVAEPEPAPGRERFRAALADIRPAALKRLRGTVSDEVAGRADDRRRRWLVPGLALAAAAALVVAIALGGWVSALDQQRRDLVASASAAAADQERERDLLTAPDARVLSTRSGSERYAFLVSRERNEALFLGTGLADPGQGRTYQLWTLTGTTAAPDGRIPGSDRTRAWMTNDIRRATALAVSLEPTGGSSTPTTIRAVVEL